MPIVRHGRMDLSWCLECDVPLIQHGSCPNCKGTASSVKYTPPGDIRPAFIHDLDEVVRLADEQWGKGAGDALGLKTGPVLMNPCPAPDRLDEVISRGAVIGSISFSSLHLRSTFILREQGGIRLVTSGFRPSRGFVECDPTAIPFILDGKNLLSPGITSCSVGIFTGDEVIVVDGDGRIIGSGQSRKTSDEMVDTKGMGVKIRWTFPPDVALSEPLSADIQDWSSIWNKVVEINRGLIDKKVRNAVSFIKKVVKEKRMPAAVSYSGGKDSLATLLLTLDAGLKVPVIFVDTGIEFPETVKHVNELSKDLDLDLLVGSPESSFFDLLPQFGPPGRDYRWCCKSSKLGPTSKLVRENFPDGVLTFIGQRRFESGSREKKGPVWKNPWVPLQTGASPVQDWTALDIWLYIFMKKIPYNPLYEKGFQRIGCWLCPSCDLAENALVEMTEVDTTRWRAFLEEERKDRELPDEWLNRGFHRFKKLPPHMVLLEKDLKLEGKMISRSNIRRERKGLLVFVEETGSCADGLSLEGSFREDLDQTRFSSLLNIIGPVYEIEGTGGYEVRPDEWPMYRASVEEYPDGTMVIRGRNAWEIEATKKMVISVIKRAFDCIGCGICIGRCESSALSLDNSGKVMISPERCIHCRKCLGPCPAESFERDPYDI